MNDLPRTLFDKLWESHRVAEMRGDQELLYIDLHLLHEVTSPQAFEGLRLAGRRMRCPELSIATVDHSLPTRDRDQPWKDSMALAQVEALRSNCTEFGVQLIDVTDERQGIVHVIGPELGLTQPGMTIVCGDSHTATHGAFGALAFGIGTSEVEHVMATQTIAVSRPKTMAVEIVGRFDRGVTAKDCILSVIAEVGVDGGAGHVIEYRGPLVESMSMEARMTLCNMSIEAGARAGMVAPDEKTFRYLEGRAYAPRGDRWQQAANHWRTLGSDPGASFDKVVQLDASHFQPRVTWGTNPAQSIGVNDRVPRLSEASSDRERQQWQRALEYMGIEEGQSLSDLTVDQVFVGSCTNARLEDLRAAARVVEGRKVAASVKAMVVPGSGSVRAIAEEEGLHEIFRAAGFEWREPGCSMCIAMNGDTLAPGQRCASTSNRNFEGRQGSGGRTHLVSPAMAAAAAVAGRFVDVREMMS